MIAAEGLDELEIAARIEAGDINIIIADGLTIESGAVAIELHGVVELAGGRDIFTAVDGQAKDGFTRGILAIHFHPLDRATRPIQAGDDGVIHAAIGDGVDGAGGIGIAAEADEAGVIHIPAGTHRQGGDVIIALAADTSGPDVFAIGRQVQDECVGPAATGQSVHASAGVKIDGPLKDAAGVQIAIGPDYQVLDAFVSLRRILLGPEEFAVGIIFDEKGVVVVGSSFEKILSVIAFIDVDLALEGAAEIAISGRIDDDGVARIERRFVAESGGVVEGEGEKAARFEGVDRVHRVWVGQHSGRRRILRLTSEGRRHQANRGRV